MSLFEGRGGVPHIWRETINTTGRPHKFPFTCKYLQIRVATSPCKVYFTQADFDADQNYVNVPVPAAETPYGEWQGPVEAHGLWLKGNGGNSAVELVAYQRRG